MVFNKHSPLLEGKHAFLGASKYHWINYDPDKLERSYLNYLAVENGTRLHAFAKQAILLGVKLPETKNSLNKYVNDAISFGMIPEQMLYYSPNCFGTSDAILFDDRINFLRIHDYKSGKMTASMHQLEIYAAIFCLEYHKSPKDIGIELRIYQNGHIIVSNPEPEIIQNIMDKIVDYDQRIERLKAGGYLP